MIQTPIENSIWTIVVAAGSGSRFGAQKQFLDLCGERVVDRTVRVASSHSVGVVVVLPADSVGVHDAEGFSLSTAPPESAADVRVVAGAASRSGSVRNGLAAVPHEAMIILIHDGARPLAGDGVYERVISAVVGGADAAVPVVALTDTIRDRRSGVIDRSTLVAVQTPQAFRAQAIRSAHASEADATDDATLVEADGGKVVLVDGHPDNMKITDPSDLAIAKLLLERRPEIP